MSPAPRRRRVAIVTGAGSGIGAAVSRRLAADGAAVLLAFAPGQPRQVEDTVDAIRAAGGEAHARAADAGDEAQVQALVEACGELLGPPEIVVANAGVATRAAVTELDAAALEQLLAIDLLGVHHLFRASLGSMLERGWGRLLATASTSGYFYGWREHAAYCAAKAGVVGLVRAYAVEAGAEGVTANAVAPGVVRSPQSLDAVNSLGEEGLRAVAALVPARRVGAPEDVAEAFAFLAGEGAAYVNGQTIVVDGGLSVVEPG